METGVKEVELRDLWRRYKDEDDQSARERLVVAYSPMVKFVAGRLGAGLPSHVDDADLISYGLMGLIGAIERFEPERGIKFETFAMTRIRGAIIDELRSLDWVPRSVRLARREIEAAQDKLEHELQRAPTEAELAAKLGIERGELQTSLLEIANSSVYALDELWTVSDSSGDKVSLLDTISDPRADDPQESLASSEIKDRLTEAIASLPEREQLVVALYYYENLTLREIGEVLGVTESRVSQLHTKAVMRLKSTCSRIDLSSRGCSVRMRASQGRRPDSQRRPDRAPGQRQDEPARGDAVRGRGGQPARHGRRRHDRLRPRARRAGARRCRSTPRSPDLRARRPRDQPDRHPGRAELRRRRGRRAARRRRRRRRRQRRRWGSRSTPSGSGAAPTPRAWRASSSSTCSTASAPTSSPRSTR